MIGVSFLWQGGWQSQILVTLMAIIRAVVSTTRAGILIAKPLVQEEGYVYTDHPGAGVVVLCGRGV